MEQIIEGDSKSFNLNYVDWHNPNRNTFHVTVEYSVERSRSTETARPDIVLFVNGIPFCVIECKAPQVEVLEPHYSITQAVEDGAIVPLLYESRHVEMTQNEETVDLWFKRCTQGLNEKQKADLKQKIRTGRNAEQGGSGDSHESL